MKLKAFQGRLSFAGNAATATGREGDDPWPVRWGDMYATLFHHLGIRHDHDTIMDNSGRPQHVVEDGGQPLRELV